MSCCCLTGSNKVDPADGAEDRKKGKPRDFSSKKLRNFTGPLQNRSCTDILCCILFLLFLLAQAAVAYFAFTYGDARVILYPKNSDGEYCGVDKQAGKPYLVYFDLVRCATTLLSGCAIPHICVEQCPRVNFVWLALAANETLARAIGRPVDLGARHAQLRCVTSVNLSDASLVIADLVREEKCAAYYLKSTAIFKRCVPSLASDLLNSADQALSNLRDKDNKSVPLSNVNESSKNTTNFLQTSLTIQFVIDDVINGWFLIVGGIVIGAVLSISWCLLMKWTTGPIIYASLFAFFLVLLGSCSYAFYKYADLDNTESVTNKNGWLVLGIVTGVVTLVTLLVLIFIIKSIALAIGIIEEASKTIRTMISALFFPLFPFLLTLATIAFSGAIVIYLLTISQIHEYHGSIEGCDTAGLNLTQGSYEWFVELGKSRNIACILTANSYWPYYLHAYNLFMFFWITCFIGGLGKIVLAGAFASWYFARDKPGDVPTLPILQSFGRVLRYHLGTVAFGSLIIAIFKFIRAILTYIQARFTGGNCAAKFLLCILICCLKCLECCLKFLTKNAYIVTAIYGENFCRSACNVIRLMLRNCIRMIVVDRITTFILFLGKMFITGAVGTLAYFFFNGTISVPTLQHRQWNYFFVPVVIVIVGTYLVASLFFDAYDFCVDTLFICVMEDLEMNDGSEERPYYMSKGLMRILTKKNKFKDVTRGIMSAKALQKAGGGGKSKAKKRGKR